MNEIFDWLRELDWMRVLLLVGAALLILPAVWGELKNVLPRLRKLFVPSTPAPTGGGELTALVAKWEDLYHSVEQAGLTDAAKKLKELFPLLVQAEKDNARRHT